MTTLKSQSGRRFAGNQAEVKAVLAEARTAGFDQGVKQERERILGILAMPEAKDRYQMALKLALNPALSMDAARDILKGLPIQQGKTLSKAQAEESFDDWMMASGGGAGVPHAEPPGDMEADNIDINTERVYARRNAPPEWARDLPETAAPSEPAAEEFGIRNTDTNIDPGRIYARRNVTPEWARDLTTEAASG